MEQIFTQNDLVRFIYNETSAQEKRAIQDALANNWQLKETYDQLLETVKLLDTEPMQPSKTSIDLILEHGRKVSPLTTPA